MSYPVYEVPDGDTLPVLFDSFDGGTGASITMTGLAVGDIKIFKDGGTTQRSSTAGFTLLDTDGIDFDTMTGIHGFSIDTSDNTDAGFYTVGAWFHVVIDSITIDAQTVRFVACAFRIVPAEASAGVKDVNVASIDSNAITAASIAASALNGKGDWALASVLGALTDAAAAGDPTTADTVMQYVKQLINVLIGTSGVATFPAEAAPANAVSLAEVLRAIHADVTGLNGDAMRGTDSAALASVCTEGRLAELDSGNIPADVDAILTDTGTTLDGKIDTIDSEVGQILADTADMQPKLGTPAGASISADIAAVKTEADKIALSDAGAGVSGSVIEEVENRALQTTADAIETDTQDIQARLPAALVSGKMDSDARAIDSSTAAATKLSKSAQTIETATCEGTPTTTTIQTDLAETTDDHYIGRIAIFIDGAGARQASDITDYTGSTGTITVTALTTAPSAGDELVII